MPLREDLKDRAKKGRDMVPVPTPEWEGITSEVHLCKESVRAFDRWYDASADNGRALFVAMFSRDSVGNRLFNDADAGWLGEEDFCLIDRIFAAGMELNRSPIRAGAAAPKNLPSGPSEGDLPSS